MIQVFRYITKDGRNISTSSLVFSSASTACVEEILGLSELRIDCGGDGRNIAILLAGGTKKLTGKRTNRKGEMPVREHRASDYLKTSAAIAAYLNVVFEYPDTDCEDLMIALRNVADAIGGAPNRPVPHAFGAEYPQNCQRV